MCLQGVAETAIDFGIGLAELVLFVVTVGGSSSAKGGVTVTKKIFKDQVKKGIKKLGKEAVKEAGKEGRQFIMGNLERVSRDAAATMSHQEGFADFFHSDDSDTIHFSERVQYT